ncbi:MAG: hypothetical protein K0Q87_3897 [Neobacillus sp.]|nr:hypothetical protein [Neobacillus sp.]
MVQKAVFRALIGILIICDSLELINGSTINEIFRWNCTIVVYFTIFLLFHAFFSKFILRRQFESNKRLQKETIYQFANDNIKCIFSDGSGELYYKWDE